MKFLVREPAYLYSRSIQSTPGLENTSWICAHVPLQRALQYATANHRSYDRTHTSIEEADPCSLGSLFLTQVFKLCDWKCRLEMVQYEFRKIELKKREKINMELSIGTYGKSVRERRKKYEPKKKREKEW